MGSPKISVLLPVYNAEKYLKDAIDSVLCQTYDDFEFLIYNDGSADSSLEIIRSYSDSRIKVYDSKRNFGYSKQLRNGIKDAQGQYIARMDSDDKCYNNRFEKQIEFLEKYKDIDIVGSSYNAIDENGDFKYEVLLPSEPWKLAWSALFFNPICHPSVMIRKSILLKYAWKSEMEPAEDYNLWLRILPYGKIANLPDKLLEYRIQDKSESHSKRGIAFKSSLQSLKMFTDKLGGGDFKNEDILYFVSEKEVSKKTDFYKVYEFALKYKKLIEKTYNLNYTDKRNLNKIASVKLGNISHHIRKKNFLKGLFFYFKSILVSPYVLKSNLKSLIGD